MIVRKDYKDKAKSVYICDRCQTELSIDNKVALYIGIYNRNMKKKWDLCKRCYKALVKGIERGNE